jgi:histidinol phosphatase-like enzyme (inositol monophosphatase family)
MAEPTSPPAQALSSRLATALEIARAGGEVGLHYFRSQRFDIETKADGSPVTVADKETERALRRDIEAAFPDDGILGEEFPEKPGSSGYRWVIDPIDGTASFVHGVPLYGVLIGVEREKRSMVGVVHMPALDETVYAARGQGALFRARGEGVRPARVTRTTELKQATVCITGFEYFAKAGREQLILEMGRACRRMRGWSDCYSHVLAATGRIDGVVEAVMHPWDGAASIVIMEEAGGRYTDFDGNATAHGANAVISNGLIHDQMRKVIGDAEIPY